MVMDILLGHVIQIIHAWMLLWLCGRFADGIWKFLCLAFGLYLRKLFLRKLMWRYCLWSEIKLQWLLDGGSDTIMVCTIYSH